MKKIVQMTSSTYYTWKPVSQVTTPDITSTMLNKSAKKLLLLHCKLDEVHRNVLEIMVSEIRSVIDQVLGWGFNFANMTFNPKCHLEVEFDVNGALAAIMNASQDILDHIV